MLEVRLVTRASSARVVGPYNGRLKVSVCSPPVEGRANAELISLLSGILRMPKSGISIKRGERSHDKSVAISAASIEEIRAKLLA